ncbi:hypothetical protein [Candidatus Methylobacter oryzae]|uniref:Uncharacterized protein n=1 Tax=Candidatus Methylobacter oryzae TaxID=2497749 RepID=A0ABY3CAQ0_9GAMM|nr:hypothetical protein [Candidatus Methylobacter oryzae]TRW95394.1 hypothetical protein EKO24_010065 [Candidatus Methylobacter oryzae]
MSKLSELLCGDYRDLGELSEVLDLLASTIDDFSTRCFDFLQREESEDIVTLGAYCGRALLEASCIALIGRITPYRLLLLKRYQEQPTFDLGIRHKISIEWKGDILPKNTVPKDQLWNKVEDKNLTSPLLSDYMWDIYWIPAFKRLLDDTVDESHTYLRDLASIPPEGICQSLRKEAEELYSSLSKGIHQEFIIPHAVAYDAITVQNLLQRTVILVTRLALISHYIPTSAALINKEKLLEFLTDIEQRDMS